MSEGLDLSGMRLVEDVIDEQAFLEHGEKVLDHFDAALAKGRGMCLLMLLIRNNLIRSRESCHRW